MRNSGAAPGKREIRWVKRIMLAALAIGFFGWPIWYLNSAGFEASVRNKLITELERVTGGKAEIESFHWRLWGLKLEADNLTIRGLEAEGQAPLVHIDRLLLELKLFSLMRGQMGLKYFAAERPVVHIAMDSLGTSNLPRPGAGSANQAANTSAAESLLQMAVNRFELHDGELLWNDQNIPLEVAADAVQASFSFQRLSHSYSGSLSAGTLESRLFGGDRLLSKFVMEFVMNSSGVEIQSLRWQSATSQAEASGRISNLAGLKVMGLYSLNLDLADAATALSTKSKVRGQANISGQGAWSQQGFSATGVLRLQGVECEPFSGPVHGLNMQAKYSFDRESFRLQTVSGQWTGGTIDGELKIQHWLETQNRKRTMAEPQAGSGHLQFHKISVGALAAAFSTERLPLGRLNLQAEAGGMADFSWRESLRDLSVKLSASIEPLPEHATTSGIALQGNIAGSYDAPRQTLQLEQVNLATRDSNLSAHGALGTAGSRLNISLHSDNLSELLPAMVLAPLPVYPFDLRGNASFDGFVSGKLNAPVVTGHLETSDFSAVIQPLAVPASLKRPPQQANLATQRRAVHWQHMVVDVSLGPHQFTARNGIVEQDGASAKFDLSSELQNYAYPEAAVFSLSTSSSSVPLTVVRSWTGLAFPVDGVAEFNGQAHGNFADPWVDADFRVLNGSALGHSFTSLAGKFHLVHQEAQLENASLQMEEARIHGSGSLNLATQALRFTVASDDYDLAHVKQLQGHRVKVEGVAALHVSAAGTLPEPNLQADLALQRLVFNGEKAGNFNLHCAVKGRNLEITGQSEFIRADLAVRGNVDLQGTAWPARITATFTHLDFDPLLSTIVRGRITEHSSVNGHINVTGPLLNLAAVRVDGEFAQAELSVQNIKLESQGPTQFTLQNNLLSLNHLHVVGEGTDLTAEGTVPLQGASTGNMHAEGSLNLEVLETLNPDVEASGVATLTLDMQGSLHKPAITGRVAIVNAGFSLADLPNGLSGVNGSMVFNENRLRVESLSAHTGGGLLQLGGFIAYANGLNFNLTAQGNDIRVRYPPGLSALVNANLRWQGTLQNSQLGGEAIVSHFTLNPQFDFAQYLVSSGQSNALIRPDSPLNNIHLDVHIVTTPELQVQASLAKVSGRADLRVRGTLARPAVLGKVNIFEGQAAIGGTTFHVDRGEILFANPVRNDPAVNLEVSARVRDYDVTLGLHGTLDHLSTTFRSDPPLPTSDIIALLALGRTRQDTQLNTQPQSNAQVSASSAMLTQALNTSESNRVQRLFGASSIKIDPEAGGVENNPSARLTAQQQVSDKVTLTYITNLTQSAQQIVQMEFRLNQRVSLVAIRDQNGVLGFDVRIRQRKR